MATNPQESTVNDGAILFANKDSDNDPFQSLSTTNANAQQQQQQQQQPKMTPSNSQTTQQTVSGTTTTTTTASAAPVVKQQQQQPVETQQEEPIAGDASALFSNSGGNDTNELFGTTDSLFPNGQGAQEDPFFSQQQQPQPQQTHSATTTTSGYDQQQYGQQQHGYGGYAQQGQQQYDQQQAYGQQQQQQQQQYDPSSYDQQYSQQGQQQQLQYGQYDPYANYQYQQQPQQDPYAAAAYQPAATTSSTTQASTTNTTNAAMTTNYYEQSAYDPQQYNNNYYTNYNQSADTTSTAAVVTGASQTRPGETTEQQYNPYDPAAQQQYGHYGQQQQQQQYATSTTGYDATNASNASTQYDPYNPTTQQQQDTYSQYSQPQYQHQQQQNDAYSQYSQQDIQYGQYNYYGADQNVTGTAASEVQSAQQEQYAPFDTASQSDQQQQQPVPPPQQQQQPPQQTGGYESLGPSAQTQQPEKQQGAFASVGTGSEVHQQDAYALVGGAESQQPHYDPYAPVEGGAAQVQPQEQQTQDEHKDAFAPVDSGVDTTQHQQGGGQQEDAYAQYNQYNYYTGYDQSGGGAVVSEVQVSQQEEYTSFDTSIQSQQEQFAQFDTGVSEVQTQAVEEFAQFETGVYQPQQQEGTTAESKEPVQQQQPQEHPREISGGEREMEGATLQQQQSQAPAPPKSSVETKQDNEATAVVQPLHPPAPPPPAAATAVVPETDQTATTDDQVVPPSAYDPYQPSSYTNTTYTQDQTTATNNTTPAVYTPSKPDEAHAATPPTVESAYIGRSSIEQNRTETSTVQSGSMLSRLASPQLEQLLPCPDPGCEGENKAKAKFCCECGRPLTSGVSRSVTPIMPAAAQQQQQQQQPPTAIAATIPDMSSYQPYAPMQQQQQPVGQDMYTPDYSAEPATLMVGEGGVPQSAETMSYYPETGAEVYDPQAAEQQQQQQQQQAQYPPDPLQRARGCPIVTFGFGGKMCVMFPQTVQRFTSHAGYESGAPITKAMPSAVRISKLKDVVGGVQNPTVASLANFVGPVLNDSKGSTKSKKKEVLAYVDKRIEELTAALPGLEGLGVEYRHAENRVLLWLLIKTLTENDGSIGDGDKMDNAVRALVQPIEKGDENDQGNFSVPAYAQADGGQQDEDAENRERSKKVLSKLEAYLVKGDRSGAVEYAMQEDLWAHALILGSCVNKDVWKKVVTNFVERELSQSAGATPRQDRLNVTGDKQALRVLYSLFAGSGAASISEFLPAATPQQRLGTPFGVPPQTQPPQATEDQLQEWRITLTLILANRTPRDTEAITSLGDILRTHGWLDAAHICYLVSPQSSLHSGIDAPHVRLTLIGAEGTTAFSDLDAYYLTELYEFALSTKQGGASSLPFLQGYKLVHAWWLADFGYLTEAQRYCEAIANSIKGYTKGSPYLHRQLLENLKEFGELCEAASGHSIGDTKSWVKNKLSKNMLESMWGSFEGKFNKFVSGEDMPPEEPPVRKSTEIMGTPYDATKDGPPARSASAFDFRNAARSSIGPESLRRAATPTANMASEAYDDRRSSSPGVRGAGPFAHAFTPLSHYGQMHEQPQQEEQMSQDAATTAADQQQQSDQYQDNSNAYGYGQAYGAYGYGAQPTNATTSPFGHSASATPATEQQQQHGMSYYGQDSYSNGPSAGYGEQQQQQNGYGGYDAGGWYGSEQQQPEPAAAAPSYEPPTPAASNYEPSYQGEDDDLGFGNSSLAKSKPVAPPAAGSGDANNENQAQAAAPEPSSQENPTDKPHEADEKKTDEGKGWRIFSLFSRSSTPSNSNTGEKKAVKANLGEESAFYYDEKEKRWVNKNAPAQAAPAPLPPPPKASSSPAPPSSSSSSTSNIHHALTPPPNAPPSTTASTPPQRPPAMMRSGSTPASATATTPPARSATSPPPSGGARRAGRKPMRSRYVDVFNQPGN